MSLLQQPGSPFGRKDLVVTAGKSSFLLDSMLGLSHQYGKPFDRRRSNSVVNWAVGFEKVLEDPAGLKTFTEFLKREFSAENIRFWVLCENYRNQADKRMRKQLASEIVEHHVCAGAPEPVNIDSQTRQDIIQGVESSAQDLFIPAQKQIFNLMKFDCYQRFLKSDLFSESLTAEKLGKPLPFQDSLGSKSPKKSRSRSKSRDKNRLQPVSMQRAISDQPRSDNSEPHHHRNSSTDEKDDYDEKKRKSLLPWQKGRVKNAESERSGSRSPVLRERNTNFRRSKRKTEDKKKSTERDKSLQRNIESLPNATQTPMKGLPINELNHQCLLASENGDSPVDFCRVILPDSSAGVLTTRQDETVGEAILKLMAKHGVPQTAVEAFTKNSSQAVDMRSPLSSLNSQELIVEARIVFRLELPSKETIVIVAKPQLTCLDVLQPILNKYGLNACKVILQHDSTQVPVNMTGSIISVSGSLIKVTTKDLTQERSEKNPSVMLEDSKSDTKVTTVIMESIMKGELSLCYDELGILQLETNGETVVLGKTDLTSCGDAVLRRNSFNVGNEKGKSRSLYTNRASIHEGMGIKIQLNENSAPQETSTTPRRNTAKNVHYRDSCDFTGVWNRTQKRLDDQRGTELNCELPEFLKLKRDTESRKVSESDL